MGPSDGGDDRVSWKTLAFRASGLALPLEVDGMLQVLVEVRRFGHGHVRRFDCMKTMMCDAQSGFERRVVNGSRATVEMRLIC